MFEVKQNDLIQVIGSFPRENEAVKHALVEFKIPNSFQQMKGTNAEENKITLRDINHNFCIYT